MNGMSSRQPTLQRALGLRCLGACTLAILVAACGKAKGPLTSSSSHWVVCQGDSDCSILGEAVRCGAEGYCLDGESDGGLPVSGDPTSSSVDATFPIQEEGGPAALEIDESFLYWTTGDELRRSTILGGEVVTLATGQGIGRPRVGGDFVYFTDSVAGTVSRVPRAGGTVQQIGVGENASDVAVTTDTVYWATSGAFIRDGSIMAAALDGSNPRVLGENLAHPQGLAVDDEFVYFASGSSECIALEEGGASCFGGGVNRVPRVGGAAEQIDAEGTPTEVLLTERGLYWMLGIRVMFAPHGEPARQLVEALGEGTGPIAIDAQALYWGTGERVLRLPLAGGQPQRLVGDLEGTRGIAVSEDWVYVAETGRRRIQRVAKDGSSNQPTGPITGPCPTPVGEPGEIALTPRADENLELLALSLEPDALTASQANYERIVADMRSIRALQPAIASIGFFAPNDGKTLSVGFTDIALESVRAGDYSAWDCLNDFYELESQSIVGIFNPSVRLKLAGIYNLGVLAELYRQLPGVEYADPDSGTGDGSSLCVGREGTRYEYVVDRAGGDCPAGCTEHEARRFVSSSAGVVQALEAWNSLNDPITPDWFVQICR